MSYMHIKFYTTLPPVLLAPDINFQRVGDGLCLMGWYHNVADVAHISDGP